MTLRCETLNGGGVRTIGQGLLGQTLRGRAAPAPPERMADHFADTTSAHPGEFFQGAGHLYSPAFYRNQQVGGGANETSGGKMDNQGSFVLGGLALDQPVGSKL